jgi:hypothetical protein
MRLSLRDAAKHAGVSKTTILRAIKSGRLSAPRNEDGGYSIDPAELFRVYPQGGTGDQMDRNGTGTKDQDAPPLGPEAGPPWTTWTAWTDRTTALEAEIAALKELVRRLDLDKEDLKSERDAWKQQAERLALAPPAVPRVSLWRRVFR